MTPPTSQDRVKYFTINLSPTCSHMILMLADISSIIHTVHNHPLKTKLVREPVLKSFNIFFFTYRHITFICLEEGKVLIHFLYRGALGWF